MVVYVSYLNIRILRRCQLSSFTYLFEYLCLVLATSDNESLSPTKYFIIMYLHYKLLNFISILKCSPLFIDLLCDSAVFFWLIKTALPLVEMSGSGERSHLLHLDGHCILSFIFNVSWNYCEIRNRVSRELICRNVEADLAIWWDI